MNQTEFWHLIDTSKQTAAGDTEAQEAEILATLSQHAPSDIINFERLLRRYILQADDFGVIAAQKIIQGYVSDDPYLYSRCWLIGQGEQVYFEALRNPDSLAELDVMAENTDFEALSYVATDAFSSATGVEEEDESFPRDIAREEGLDYDRPTETKGREWVEEELPSLLPKLWNKFN